MPSRSVAPPHLEATPKSAKTGMFKACGTTRVSIEAARNAQGFRLNDGGRSRQRGFSRAITIMSSLRFRMNSIPFGGSTKHEWLIICSSLRATRSSSSSVIPNMLAFFRVSWRPCIPGVGRSVCIPTFIVWSPVGVGVRCMAGNPLSKASCSRFASSKRCSAGKCWLHYAAISKRDGSYFLRIILKHACRT